jgi:hypothetical protein
MAEEFGNIVYEVHELPHLKKQPKLDLHGKCIKCFFWQSLKNGYPSANHNVRGLQGEDIGECRFNAPSLESEQPWPVTYEFDWCGHFQAKAGMGGLAASH